MKKPTLTPYQARVIGTILRIGANGTTFSTAPMKSILRTRDDFLEQCFQSLECHGYGKLWQDGEHRKITISTAGVQAYMQFQDYVTGV